MNYNEWYRGIKQVGNQIASGLYGNGTDLSSSVSVNVGDSILISGEWFDPGIVYIRFDGAQVVGTVTASAWQTAQIIGSTAASPTTGSFSTDVTIPTADAGSHFLAIEDSSQGRLIIIINVLARAGALAVSVSPASLTMDMGRSTTFNATASGGSGTYKSYQWYVNGVSQVGQTASTFSFVPLSAATYLITSTVTDSNNLTSAQSNTATVTVDSAATVSVSPGSATLDVGQSQLFTASPSGGSGTYTSYQWYVNGIAQVGQTASTFSFVPASAGSYSITATITDSTGTTSAQSTAATATVNPTATPTPAPTAAPTAVPNATPTPSPTPSATTVPATTDSGATVDLAISGNITSSQMSNVTIATNPSADTNTVSFSVTGESGTTGFGNITIPKSAVTYGTTPTIYIDGQPAQNQGYTQNSNNYYVWYTTHFSTHQISIIFTTTSSSTIPTASPKQAQPSLAQDVIFGVAAAVALEVSAAFALEFKSRKPKTKKRLTSSSSLTGEVKE